MKSTPRPTLRHSLSGGPQVGEDTGSRLAMLLLFMLLVVQLMEGGTAGQDKEASKGEAKDDARGVFTMDGNELSAFNCEEGQTKVLKMPTHEDCVVAGGEAKVQTCLEGRFRHHPET